MGGAVNYCRDRVYNELLNHRPGGTRVGKIVTIEYFDDLDGVSIGADSVDTVEFSYRGKDYSLVLTNKNGAQFDKDVARYIRAAKKAQARDAKATRTPHRVEPRKAPSTKTAPAPKAASRKKPAAAPDPQRTRSIREWASANGHTVSARGRIPAVVVDAYDAAH